MFSVALSVGSPRLAVSEHAAWLESGLSSPEGAITWRSPAASMVHDSLGSGYQDFEIEAGEVPEVSVESHHPVTAGES